MTATTEFARFLVGDGPTPPSRVRDLTKLHVLDTLGCAIAAVGRGEAGFLDRGVIVPDRGYGASVVGSDTMVTPRAAALANGALSHILEYDSTHPAAIAHLSAVTVPAALAIAEDISASGARTIEAIILGTEVGARIGRAAAGAFAARGFHSTSVCGVFSSAGAVARLLGLDVAGTSRALQIAASFASGLGEALRSGAVTKALHAGWAAQAGIEAAFLGSAGCGGAETALEGEAGLLRAFGGVEEPQAALDREVSTLGDQWEGELIAIKALPVCHFAHGALLALSDVLAETGYAANVESIRLRVPSAAVPFVLEPLAGKRRPRSAYDVRFSLPYLAAYSCRTDAVGAAFLKAAPDDVGVVELAQRVTYEVVEYPTYPGNFPGGVTVTTASGETLHRDVLHEQGGRGNPMTEAEICQKFAGNASLGLPDERAQELQSVVLRLESAEDVAGLTGLLRKTPETQPVA